jgi:hypothetical protein
MSEHKENIATGKDKTEIAALLTHPSVSVEEPKKSQIKKLVQ